MGRLRRRIGKSLELLFMPHYPSKSGRDIAGDTFPVLLGIGGNIGDVPRRFEHLWHYLARSTLLEIIECSPVLINPPFGYREQPDFFNAVLYARTRLTPEGLLRYLLETERRFGRRRSFENAPRTLDIDILLFGMRHIDRPGLKIPHPGWAKRESVTIPMNLMKGLPWSKRHLQLLRPMKLSE